ncbi:MAG: M56 family metallopeptidase, partial [Rhizomicrobium sp.]
MASLNSWLSAEVMRALGWALIHSLWQSLGVAALAAALMAFSRRPPLRYLVAVAALALMLALPAATFFVLMKSAAPAAVAASPGAFIAAITEHAPAITNASPLAAANSARGFSPSVAATPTPGGSVMLAPSPNVLPWLVAAWLLGVAFFSLRFAGGFLLLEHKRRSQSTLPNPRILAICRELQAQLGLTRAIRYLESNWLQAPAVIGWLRPIVLLPVTALIGLSEAQLRAVIAHELAHIRRLDALVNLFQILVEALLFYHPAVWWLNKRIRAERELCCDEIALSVSDDRLEYAKAITLMAQWQRAPALAMAANRGPLTERVFHILGHKSSSAGQRMIGLAGSMVFLAAAITAANALLVVAAPPIAQAKESITKSASAALSSVHSAGDQALRQALKAMAPSQARADDAGSRGARERFEARPGQVYFDTRGENPMKLIPKLSPVVGGALVLAASAALAQPAQAPANPPTAPAQSAESITVTATPLPGRSAVDEFIYAYPKDTRNNEKIARWKNGICPVVEGLPARYANFISGRLIAIARQAGAPVSDDPKCRHNIQILFTPHPQDAANQIAADHRPYLGWFDNLHQAADLAKVTHDIQSWYLTATITYRGAMIIDDPRANFRNNDTYAYSGANNDNYVGIGGGGGRLNNGLASSLHNVIIVADSSKLANYETGALADYIAMLALSQPKSFDACWEVPSITNLLAKDCEPARKTATISDNDVAFLHGLYKMSTGDSIFMQRNQIRYFVQRNKEQR